MKKTVCITATISTKIKTHNKKKNGIILYCGYIQNSFKQDNGFYYILITY